LCVINLFIDMSKHTDKINAMNSAGKTLNDEWVKNKITPEKNEEEMKEKIGQIITKNRKKGFSFFR
jgi:predicted double-glycine peptidase